jgi:rod shape-determining protein MreC
MSLENAQLKDELHKNNIANNLLNNEIIPATIIARDNESGIRFLTIDAGSKRNIKVDMPVLSTQGLVGKVIATTDYQSIVETALSPSLKISARDNRSRVVGVIEYSNLSSLRFKYTFAESDIQTGDTIISSGLGGIFPKGLNIGIVNSIRTDPAHFFQYVDIKPIINFNTLDRIFVLISEISSNEEQANENLNTETIHNLKIRVPINPRMR